MAGGGRQGSARARLLEESERRLQFVLEMSRTGYWDLDLEDHTANRTLLHDRIFGYDSLLPEWTYEMFLDHVLPEDRGEVDRKFRMATKRGEDWNFECRIRRKDGHVRWIWAAGRHIAGDRGARRMAGIVQDITERKEAEVGLRASEEKLRGILNATQESIWMFDTDGVVLLANTIAMARIGKGAQDIIGKRMRDIISPQLAQSRMERLKEVVGSGRPVEFLDERAGMHFRHSFYPVVNNAGAVTGVVSFSRDITERRNAEEALRESEERFRTITETSRTPVGVGSLDGTILYVNRAYEEVFGYSAGELLGMKAPELYWDPADRQRWVDALREGRPVHGIEVRMKRMDGTPFWVLLSITPMNYDGTEAVMGTFVDITERKKAESALRKALERNAQQEKLAAIGRLAGGVAHELRNPLAAMKNAAYYLGMTADRSDSSVAETIAVINREIVRSDGIISSLLGLARPAQPSRRDVDLSALLQATLGAMSPPAGIALDTKLDEALPPVAADPAQLSIVFGNIIRNAYEAMPGGGRISVSSGHEGNWVVVTVADSGEGMPPEVLGRLFEPLFTTKQGGTGLGLSVAKMLVEGSGGRIEAQSEAGKGSAFTVRLPVKRRGTR